MKNFERKLRKKSQIDNSVTHLNENSQLSKKQKVVWISLLFIGAFLFSGLRGIFLKQNHLFSSDTVLMGLIISSFLMLLLSYFFTFLILLSYQIGMRLLNSDNSKLDENTKYLIWTTLLAALMMQIVLKVKMPLVGFLFH